MAPASFPHTVEDQTIWFANNRNHDFTCYVKARKAQKENLQDLIVTVVGLQSRENLEDVAKEHLYKTDLWESGTGTSAKEALMSTVYNELDRDCYHVRDRAAGYCRWLREALIVYLELEIGIAKKKARQQKTPWPRADQSTSSAQFEPFSTSSLTSTTETTLGSSCEIAFGLRTSLTVPNLTPPAFSGFPVSPHHQTTWFADPKNHDFSMNILRSKKRALEFQILVTNIIGLGDAKDLRRVIQGELYQTGLWKSSSGPRSAASKLQRKKLAQKIFVAIEGICDTKRPVGYERWVHAALVVLVQAEVSSAKQKQSTKRFREKHSSGQAHESLASCTPGKHHVEGLLLTDANRQRIDADALVSSFTTTASEGAGAYCVARSLGSTTRTGSQVLEMQMTKMLKQRDAENADLFATQNDELKRLRETITELQNGSTTTSRFEVGNVELVSLTPTKSQQNTSLASSQNVEIKFKQCDGLCIPPVITQLAPLKKLDFGPEVSRHHEFDFECLQKHLGGYSIYNGRYTVPTITEEPPKHRHYRLLTSDHEPVLPKFPGQHGAQISFIPPDTVDPAGGREFALFVRQQQGGYKYFGHYREPRAADRMGGNEMALLPLGLKKHWATVLSSQPLVSDIRKHIGAMIGIMEDGGSDDGFSETVDCSHHIGDEGGRAPRMRMDDMAWMYNILAAFERPDFSPNPSLRLFYEYMECVRYDLSFYLELVEAQSEINIGMYCATEDECDDDSDSGVEVDLTD